MTYFARGRAILKEMLDNKELLNGTIQTEDGGTFKIHVELLAAASPYLRYMLSAQSEPGSVHNLLVPGMPKDIMASVINFVYTGKLQVSMCKVNALVRASKMLKIPAITELCKEFLASRLNNDNCITVYTFAKFFRLGDLKDAAKIHLITNFQEIFPTSKDFLNLPDDDLILILSSDLLNVKSEDFVFCAIMRWVENDENNTRVHYLPNLLRCIRFGLLNIQYYERNVCTHPLTSSNDDCLAILYQASQLFQDLDNADVRQPLVDLHHPFLKPRIPFELIFVMGGWSAGSATNVMETYDSKCGRWFLALTNDNFPRAYHGMVWHRDFIYVLGGFDGNQCFNSMSRFDPLKHGWMERAPMHVQRCYVSVACVGPYIYAMGGYDGNRRSRTCERYHPDSNQWEFVASMHQIRSDASADTLDGKIYIAGGFNGNQVLDSAECYDPETDQWTLITAMSSPRSGVKVVAYEYFLYAIGGFNGSNRLNTVEKYDRCSRAWVPVPPMRGARSNFATAIIDDCLYAIGGFNGLATISAAECYDHRKNIWIPVTDLNLNRSALAACAVSNIPNAAEYSFIGNTLPSADRLTRPSVL